MTDPNWKGKAASILDEAKKLWGKVSTREPRAGSPAQAEVKLEALAQQIRSLEGEAAASFEVVRSIAQQHSSLTEQHLQLIQAAEEQLAAIRKLAWACVGLAVLVAAALVIAIAK